MNVCAEFFFKFPPSCGLRALFVSKLSLWDGPRTHVAVTPIRSTRVNEQNIDTIIIIMVH